MKHIMGESYFLRSTGTNLIYPRVITFFPSAALYYKPTYFGFQMLANSLSKGFHIFFSWSNICMLPFKTHSLFEIIKIKH